MSEGLYPPESRSPGMPRMTLKSRATIQLADLERHIAAVKAGNLSESERLAAAVAGVAGTEAKP